MSFPTGAVVDKNVDKLDASYKPIGDRCKTINEECKCDVTFLLDRFAYNEFYRRWRRDSWNAY